MNTNLPAFYLVLIGCAFGLSIYVTRFVGNIIAIGMFIVFVISALNTTMSADNFHKGQWSDLPVRTDPVIFHPIIIIWIVFIIDLILYPAPSTLLRTGAFIITSGVALFIMPAAIPRKRAFTAIGVIGAIFVLLSLPAALLGTPFRVGGIVLSDISGAPINIFDVSLRSPTSIFDLGNYFRELVAIGAVASAGVFAQTRNRWVAFVSIFNLIGVYLTLGRAAQVATIIAAGLAVLYFLAGRRALAGATILGILTTITVFAGTIGVLPTIGPAKALHSEIGQRVEFWAATIKTIAVRPTLGWGLVDNHVAIGDRYVGEFTGIHNSYLRLFLIGGIVGGVTYIILCATTIITVFDRVSRQKPFALTNFCLIVMVLIFHLFDSATIFGTNLSSLLWALTIGYVQSQHHDKPIRVYVLWFHQKFDYWSNI